MNSEQNLDALLHAAKNRATPMPSTDLIARVLADAAENVQVHTTSPQPKPGIWARLMAPIGGLGGAVALSCCATFGVVAGAGYADTLFEIPGLDSVLTTLTVNTDSTSPYESLTMIMSGS